MQIHENSKVTLHFALRLEGGETVDSTFDKKPATLCIGDGNLPEGFEKHILGLSAGDRRTVRVNPEDAFGQVNPSNRQEFDTADFAQTGAVEVGMMVSFEDAAGSELPGVITDVGDEKVTVDFNHPLAGKALDFEVEILSIESASSGH